ncbi:MAG: hypothetical protein QG608_1350 [Actinomycetota bacterium]|nr:hypothetical protein [Actinomycetota bacterium]
MLEGILSSEASGLYLQLLREGCVGLDCPEARSPAMRELLTGGFARERYVGAPQLVPIEPARALENAALLTQQRMVAQQRSLMVAREKLDELEKVHRSGCACEGDPRREIEVLTDPATIGALSVELALGARNEVRVFETEHFRTAPDPRQVQVPPPSLVERGVRFRSLYTRAVLDHKDAGALIERAVEVGWELRVVDRLPCKAVIVDTSLALLPLDSTGMQGAALVRAPVLVDLAVTLFDRLWARGVALSPGRNQNLREAADEVDAARPDEGGPGRSGAPPGMTRTQFHVLRLLCAGLTDSAIARHLGISERTVRRHITALFDLLGADNRVAAAVTAAREGLV